MRRVEVNIPGQEPQKGWFHQFGVWEKGVCMVVELEDGTIICPYTQYVKFLNGSSLKEWFT